MNIIQNTDNSFLKPRDAWDRLSMEEQAAMMKVAVKNGIYDLQDIRQKYNEFAEGGSKMGEEEGITDEQYINTMEKVAEENYKNWGYNNSDEALVHALNDNTYDYRSYYNKYPQSRANADTHWTDEFKTVYHPTFSNESIYSGQKSQYNPLGLPGGFWVGEDENASFIPMAWQVINNQYKSGGGIHIKHPGKLTALKKRTGKTEAELYNDDNPAHKKMVVFARNARKWKHGEGGNLFSGEENHSQQMNIGLNIPKVGLDVQGWPNYTLDQIVANGEKIEQQKKAIQDAYLNFVTESNDATAVANGRPQNQHLADKAVRGAKAHAAWEKEHPNLTAWGNTTSLVPFVIASAPLLGGIAETSAGSAITAGLNTVSNAIKASPAFPYIDTALSAGSTTYGINEMGQGNFTPDALVATLPGTRIFGDEERWRQSIYRNMLPFSYNLPLKATEMIPTTIDYLSMRPLNVSENHALPWQRFWGTIAGATDKSKYLGVRRQAWAKYLKQPENFEYPIYRTVGKSPKGLEMVEANIENIPFANGDKPSYLYIKDLTDATRRGITENKDRLLNNHRYMNITDLGNDNYLFNDVWDLHPFRNLTFLPDKIRNYEAGQLVGGKPFEWRQQINIKKDVYDNPVMLEYARTHVK